MSGELTQLMFVGGRYVNFSATSQKGWLMPKVLCLTGMVISVLVFLIFIIDLIFGMSGMLDLAPFRLASVTMDVIFLVASGGLAYAAWTTFREQK